MSQMISHVHESLISLAKAHICISLVSNFMMSGMSSKARRRCFSPFFSWRARKFNKAYSVIEEGKDWLDSLSLIYADLSC